MPFTKVAPAGIGTEPGDGYRIGDSFLHATGLSLGSGTTISHSGSASFSGIVTASSFVGSGSGLTGVASTDHINSSTNAVLSGIVTAGTLNVSGNATVTGTLGVGGTLTYEDVTNIDSVGVITARSDLSIADKIIHTGDTDTSIRFPGANEISFETAGSERVRINSTGNMGLGVASPNVLNEPAKFQELTLGGKTEGAAITLKDTDGNVQGGLFTSDATGAMIVRTITNHFMQFRTNNTERARIDTSGRLIIGDTDTNNAFSGGDDLVIGNTSARSGITLVSSTSNDGGLYFSKGTSNDQVRGQIVYQHDSDGGYMRFYTDATERLKISSDGYVTKPNQPTFHAYGNNSWTQYTGSNNTVKLLNSACNVGGHYKTSGSDEGKFVCPVAGNYFFYLTLYSGRTDNSQTDNNDYLSINFISSSGSLSNNGGHHIRHYYNEGDRDSTSTLSIIKTCTAGETMHIMISCNGTGYQIYGGHSGFGGYLIG